MKDFTVCVFVDGTGIALNSELELVLFSKKDVSGGGVSNKTVDQTGARFPAKRENNKIKKEILHFLIELK